MKKGPSPLFALLGLTAVLLLFQPPVQARDTAGAKKFNKLGMKQYKAKKYSRAVTLFSQAIKADSKYAWAHYNLACTYGVIIKLGRECEFEISPALAIGHLKKAVRYKSDIKKNLARDSDLKPLHRKVAFHLLLGRSLKKNRDVERILQQATWYSPAQDATAEPTKLRFKKDGRLTIKGEEWWKPGGKKFTHTGRYKVKSNRISYTIKGGKPGVWILGADGTLRAPGAKKPEYSDDLEKCSA